MATFPFVHVSTAVSELIECSPVLGLPSWIVTQHKKLVYGRLKVNINLWIVKNGRKKGKGNTTKSYSTHDKYGNDIHGMIKAAQELKK